MSFTIDGTPASTFGATLRDHPAGLAPAPRHRTVEIPGRPGLLRQRSEHGTRSLTLALLVEGTGVADVYAKIRDLSAALDATAGDHKIVFDATPDVEYRAVLSGEPEVVPGWDWAEVDLELVMHDPFIYGVTEETVAYQNVASGSTFTVENTGNQTVPQVISIAPADDSTSPLTAGAALGSAYAESGPVEAPKVTVDGVAFRWTGTLELGQLLVVDTDTNSVTVDGANAIDRWDPTTDFPDLPPGPISVTYESGNDAPADLEFTFRTRSI